MLINLRNALMTGKRLPYDAEVEYLESTGTQWVDTGVSVASGTVIRACVSFDVNSGINTFFGSRAGTADRTFCFFGNGATAPYAPKGFRFDYGSSGDSRAQNYAQGAYTQTKFFDVAMYGYDGGRKCVADSTTLQSSLTSDVSSNLNIYAFAINTNNTATIFGEAKIASLKIYNGSVLVRDYIPVRKGAVGYLYDRVSGKLFGNAGTGDFVLGPDVVPVEYIESHGTEYIDTGVMSSRCYGAYLDFKAIDFASYMFFVSNASADDFCVGTNANSAANTYIGRIRRSVWYSGSVDKTAFVALSCKGGKILLNDVEKGSYDDTLPLAQNDNTIRMFGLSGTQRLSQCAIRRFDLYSSSQEAIFKALPVRVSTEGAMMDVLTRRIYRNQGTGAFTYGNDLKYPIPAE